ncbi:MAG: SDR family oxidoreductase [Alphaproteobacteria bacterium]
MTELADSIVLITGGSAGIGRALADLMSARNQVIVTGRGQQALDAATGENAALTAIRSDTAKAEDRHMLRETLQARFGRLDILVNNAGIQTCPDFAGPVDQAEIEREIATNFTGPVLLTAELMPLIKAGSAPMIVNVSSGLAFAPKQAAPVYGATKAALRSFSTALRYQLEDEGIHVACVYPPIVRTAMTEGRNEGAMTAEEAARQILDGMERQAKDIYLGRARLLPLMMRLAPGFVHRQLRGIGMD